MTPVSGAIGAEISGVDLAQPLDEQTRSEIYAAFLHYLVIFFRDQSLTPAQHTEFAKSSTRSYAPTRKPG